MVAWPMAKFELKEYGHPGCRPCSKLIYKTVKKEEFKI